MQVGADPSPAGVHNLFERFVCLRLAGDREIDHIRRPDGVSRQHTLEAADVANCPHAGVRPVKRRVPVELFFRVDDNEQKGWSLAWQMDWLLNAKGRVAWVQELRNRIRL